MTIKQLGGVFGRNPTFNDVTIEGQLTFDGDIDINSDLKVDGDIEATGSVTADSLVIGTSSIDASGNLLLNTTNSPTTTEAIISSDYSAAGTTNTGLTITGRSSGNWYNNGIHALGTALAFSTATTGTTGADATNERMRIDSVGHAIIPSGVTLGTVTGVYNAAKTLDDYEEGVWIPAAWYQNGTDQAAVTNVTQTGTYTKVGNLVTVHCYLTWTISTTPVNDNIGVKNLPFTQTSQQACAAAIVGNAATNPATTWTVVGIGPSAPYVYLSDGVEGSNKADEVGGTGTKTLRFTLTYEAA